MALPARPAARLPAAWSARPDPAFWRGRRVLVTGHTGFKGAWLSAWLVRLGARVSGYALPAEPGSLGDAAGTEAGLEICHGDIADTAALTTWLGATAPEAVIHLAAQALVRRGYAEPAATFRTNVMGSVALLEAVRATPSVRAVLLATSDKVYAQPGHAGGFTEDDPLGGTDPYAASKAAAEHVVAAYRGLLPGVALASARAGNVIGGGDVAPDRLVPDCLRALAAGQPIRLRHPAATRPWQHVLDPLEGYLRLLRRLLEDGQDAAGPWNFGPDAAACWPVGRIAAALRGHWGGGTILLAAGPHPAEAATLAVDAGRARRHLGWRPRLDVAQALAWTARWHRAHAAGADAATLLAADLDRYEALADDITRLPRLRRAPDHQFRQSWPPALRQRPGAAGG